MKILSILPVDIEAVTSYVAAQKRKDTQILSSLPSHVCHSFSAAHLLLQENPLAYDYIVSAYTPDELLPGRDWMPGTRGPYGATTYHITKILENNPLVSLVLWTGALSKEINLPHELNERVTIDFRTVFPGYSRLLSGGVDVDAIELDLLRSSIERASTEYGLTLNDRGQIVLEAICRRGVAAVTFHDQSCPLPVRPCLRKGILSLDQDMGEFLTLLNQDNVTAQEVESFLDGHPCSPLGNDMPVRRWMLGLTRDGQDRAEPPADILLEPVWATKFWKIPGLKAPVFPCPRASVSERQSFCQIMATTLSQMRAKREAFNQPKFLRRLADAGLDGYSPRVALVLGGKDLPALPCTPPPGVEKKKAMSNEELLELVRTEMAWLAEPVRPPENLRFRDVILRKLKVMPEAPRPGQKSVKVARLLTVLNAGGLDLSAAAIIGKTVFRYRHHDALRMTSAGCTVSGSEIMSLLVLEASCGKQLLVEVEGPRAIPLLEELTDLFNKGFYCEEHMLSVPDSHHEYCHTPDTTDPVSGGPN